MEIVTKLINWTKGKKTYIGIALHTGLAVFTLFSNKINFKDSLEYHGYISALTGVGLIHKGTRSEAGKKIINKIKSTSDTKVSD